MEFEASIDPRHQCVFFEGPDFAAGFRTCCFHRKDEDRPPVTLVLNKIDKASEMRWVRQPNLLLLTRCRTCRELVELDFLIFSNVVLREMSGVETSVSIGSQVTSREREFKTHGRGPDSTTGLCHSLSQLPLPQVSLMAFSTFRPQRAMALQGS